MGFSLLNLTPASGTERTVRLDSDLYSLADTNQPHIPAFQIISDRYYRCESPATFPVRGVLSFFTGLPALLTFPSHPGTSAQTHQSRTRDWHYG